MAGQLVKRSKDSFTLRIFMGRDPKTGKRIYHNETFRGKKKEAEKFLTGLLRKKDLGLLVIEPAHNTLSEYLEYWLETAAKPRLRESTYYEYKGQLERYVTPALGAYKLSKLSPVAIQKVYSDMLARDLSARTVNLTHSILKNALEQALKWRMLSVNPANAVDLPKQQKQEMRAMNEEEANRFLQAAKSDRWHVLFALLLSTGLRPSEALGLKWADIDLAGSRLMVRRTVKKVKGRWVFEEPKTRNSRRTLDLPQGITFLLADYVRDGELVFTNGEGEPVRIRGVVEHHFKVMLERAGLDTKIRLYDLRHTHATLLLIAGTHPKIVSERLGHSSIAITLDTYSHVLPGMQKESAAKHDSILFGRGERREASALN